MTSAEKIARQKRTLTILIVALAAGAIALVALATRIPLPLRLLIAALDLVAAAVLWVAMRQESAKKQLEPGAHPKKPDDSLGL